VAAFNCKNNEILQLFREGASVEVIGEEIHPLGETIVALNQTFETLLLLAPDKVETELTQDGAIVSSIGSAFFRNAAHTKRDFLISVKLDGAALITYAKIMF
jgi:hypothetical protein